MLQKYAHCKINAVFIVNLELMLDAFFSMGTKNCGRCLCANAPKKDLELSYKNANCMSKYHILFYLYF